MHPQVDMIGDVFTLDPPGLSSVGIRECGTICPVPHAIQPPLLTLMFTDNGWTVCSVPLTIHPPLQEAAICTHNSWPICSVALTILPPGQITISTHPGRPIWIVQLTIQLEHLVTQVIVLMHNLIQLGGIT
jgi:hypothetical protein